MTDEIDLSIVVVSYNTRELTLQCLRSILENTNNVRFQVLVVDNNSADDSADAIEKEFPAVRVIRNLENKGLAAATNQGLEHSTGRYVMSLNSDTVIKPGAFDTLVEFMDEHPEVGAAIPRLVLPDGSEHPTFVGNIPTLRSELLSALSPLHPSIGRAAEEARFGAKIDVRRTQEVPCILWGTALIVRREILKTIGFQDARFFVYAEDVDWVMRIGRAGWKLWLVSEAEVVHYGGQSTKQASTRMLAQIHKSKSRLIQKHYGTAAGITLRLAYAGVWGTRLAKWVGLYILSSRSREEARERIQRMWAVIRAVLSY